MVKELCKGCQDFIKSTAKCYIDEKGIELIQVCPIRRGKFKPGVEIDPNKPYTRFYTTPDIMVNETKSYFMYRNVTQTERVIVYFMSKELKKVGEFDLPRNDMSYWLFGEHCKEWEENYLKTTKEVAVDVCSGEM